MKTGYALHKYQNKIIWEKEKQNDKYILIYLDYL